MFSQASSLLSIWGGDWLPSMHHRSHDRGSCLRGVCIRAGLGRPPPPSITRYGQQAGGMHPTGMHSGYRPQTKFVQVMFLHVSVILSTEGEYLGRYPLAGTSLPCRYTPPWQVTPLTGTPPGHSACWDTVNKRVVRILLECILVLFIFCMLSRKLAKL